MRAQAVEKALAEVPGDMQAQAGEIFEAAKAVLSPEQLQSAAEELASSLGPAAEQSAEAVYAVVGGALSAAGELVPEVTEAIGAALAGPSGPSLSTADRMQHCRRGTTFDYSVHTLLFV